MTEYKYVGDELDAFAEATNWKSYLKHTVAGFIRGDVLEVGAGLGTTTRFLCSGAQSSWTCLEPDKSLAERLRVTISEANLPVTPKILTKRLAELDPDQSFDTILYVDVLEHVPDDAKELETARTYLRVGGHLIVIGPAHQWLFSEFDHAIGHYRRYSRRSLLAAVPPDMPNVLLRYLDSLGVVLSAANRWFLRSSKPAPKQIRFWDRVVVRMSRLLDPLLGWRLGKTVVGVWRLDRPCDQRREATR